MSLFNTKNREGILVSQNKIQVVPLNSYKVILALIPVLLVLSISLVSAFDWSDNIVAYYKLDESSGTVIDQIGDNNGVNHGATTGVTGTIETAYDFENGDPDFINIGHNTINLTTQNITINFWTKLESDIAGVAEEIITGNNTNGWGVYFRNADKALCLGKYGVNEKQGTLYFDIGTWHMYTVVHNNSITAFYLDGVLNSTVIDTNDFTIASDYYIGNKYDGIIDEIGVWNTTLTQDNITELYGGGSGLSFGMYFSFYLNDPTEGENESDSVDFECNTSSATNIDYTNISVYFENGTLFKYNSTKQSGLTGEVSHSWSYDLGNPHHYYYKCWANDTLGRTSTSDKKRFNYQPSYDDIIKIYINDANGNLLGTGKFNITDIGIYDQTDANVNFSQVLNFTNGRTILIEAWDTENNYRPTNLSVSVNLSFDYINLDLDANELYLQFWYTNQSLLRETSGVIIDSNPDHNLTNFTNTSILIAQSEFAEGKVIVYFGDNFNATTGENWSQYFEYMNTIDNNIVEDLTIMDSYDQNIYFQVIDRSRQPIYEAEFELYECDYTLGNCYLIGQRITTVNGLAHFIVDSGKSYKYRIIHSDYSQLNQALLVGDLSAHSSYDTAYPIIVEKGYSYDEFTYVMAPSYYNTYSNSYMPVFVLLEDTSTCKSVKGITSYMISQSRTNSTFTLLDPNRCSYSLNLTSGTHYSNSVGENITLYIYADNVLVYHNNITYREQDDVLDLNLAGVDDNLLNIMVFIVIIFISGGIGFVTQNDTAGFSVLMVSGLLAGIIVAPGFLIMGLIGVLYIGLNIVRRVISE